METASMELKEIIEKLASTEGYRINSHYHGGYDSDTYHLEGPSFNVTNMVDKMLRDGWIEPAPIGRHLQLTDAGRAAYLRSTDELGDGKLIAPSAGAEHDKG